MGYGFQQWTKMLICPLAVALSRLRVHGGTERVTTLIWMASILEDLMSQGVMEYSGLTGKDIYIL